MASGPSGPEARRFPHVFGADAICIGEVGDAARHAQQPMAAARRQRELRRQSFIQSLAGCIRAAVVVDALLVEAGLRAGDTRLVLSPESDFFKYLNDPKGRTKPATGEQKQ